MDSFDEALGKLLNDPGAMAQVMSLAQSIGAGLPQNHAGPDEEALRLPAIAPQNDRQTELFRALEPYLSEKRREKLRKAVQIARLSRLAQSALVQSDREE